MTASRPDLATLIDWLEGRLDPPTAARVEAAVAEGDMRVRGTVAWLQTFLGAARTLPLHESPEEVRRGLRTEFEQWRDARPSSGRSATCPRVLVANLLFDSRKDLALAGIRGGDDADDAIHLAFTTELADLVLDIQPIGGAQLRIDGQVFQADPGAPATFGAVANGPEFSIEGGDGDKLGRFSVAAVPHQVTELRVSNGVVTIVAPLALDDRPR